MPEVVTISDMTASYKQLVKSVSELQQTIEHNKSTIKVSINKLNHRPNKHRLAQRRHYDLIAEELSHLKISLSKNDGLVSINHFNDKPFVQSKKQDAINSNANHFNTVIQSIKNPLNYTSPTNPINLVEVVIENLNHMLDEFHQSLKIVPIASLLPKAKQISPEVLTLHTMIQSLLEKNPAEKDSSLPVNVKNEIDQYIEDLVNAYNNHLSSNDKDGVLFKECLSLTQEHQRQVINKNPDIIIADITPVWVIVINTFLNLCRRLVGKSGKAITKELVIDEKIKEGYKGKFFDLGKNLTQLNKLEEKKAYHKIDLQSIKPPPPPRAVPLKK